MELHAASRVVHSNGLPFPHLPGACCHQPAAAAPPRHLLRSAGHSLQYQGLSFLNPGGGLPIFFGQATAALPAAPAPLKPVRTVPVASGAQYNLNLALGNCRIDTISSYVGVGEAAKHPLSAGCACTEGTGAPAPGVACQPRVTGCAVQVYCPNDGSAGTSPGEQFVMFSTAMDSGTALSNTPALIKSVKTGMFCRTVTAPDGLTKVSCDATPQVRPWGWRPGGAVEIWHLGSEAAIAGTVGMLASAP
jgi:hypothetical protein